LFLGADALGAALRSPDLPDLLRIFAVYPLCMLPTVAVEAALLTVNRPATATIFSAAMRLVAFGALVVPIWRKSPLPYAVGWWMVASAVAGVVAIGLTLSTVRGQAVRWSPSMLRDVWRFSLPLVALTAISLCGTYLDRFLVSHFFGVATFGTYANATVEVPTVTTVTNATAVVLMAEFARCAAAGEHGRMLATWRSATTKTAVLVLASFGFLAFWGHETMRLLFSQRFADSGAIFTIYVWAMPLYLFALRPLYVAMGATRVLAWLTAADVVAGSLLMVILGRLYGAPGIALGVVAAGYLGATLWLLVFTRRIVPVALRAFMPWRDIGVTLLVALGAGGAVRLAHDLLAPPWPPLVDYLAALGVYLPLYALGLRLVGLWGVVPMPWRRRQRLEAGGQRSEVGG
jgi:O-antigen/teichoic acid export membrane protein